MNKGFWRRFLILFLIYAMVVGIVLGVLISYFPKGFEETWVKILVVGGLILLFVGIVLWVEFKRKGR